MILIRALLLTVIIFWLPVVCIADTTKSVEDRGDGFLCERSKNTTALPVDIY